MCFQWTIPGSSLVFKFIIYRVDVGDLPQLKTQAKIFFFHSTKKFFIIRFITSASIIDREVQNKKRVC